MPDSMNRHIQTGILLALCGAAVLLSTSPAWAQSQTPGCPPAAMPAGLNFGLGSLPLLSDAKTHSICAENPTGEKGKGGMAVPHPEEPKPAASARAADQTRHRLEGPAFYTSQRP